MHPCALMSCYKPKFHKSLVCKFSKISISRKMDDQPSTTIPGEAEEGTKADRDPSIEKRSTKRSRSPRSRKLTISILAGCGCQSGRGTVIDQIPYDSQMPVVCSVQSIPSCSSFEEKYPEWISSAPFDEMLKLSSSSSSTSHDRKEVNYNFKSSTEKSSVERHISTVKFNDLVNKLRKSEEISTTAVHSADIDQKFHGNFLASPNSSSLHRTKRQNANNLVHSNVEKSLISKRKEGMTDSLLIMKSSCDPGREFKESMMEMIIENKIKDGKDMEELLACFLYLNSEDYHDVIIQVFKQLWIEFIQL